MCKISGEPNENVDDDWLKTESKSTYVELSLRQNDILYNLLLGLFSNPFSGCEARSRIVKKREIPWSLQTRPRTCRLEQRCRETRKAVMSNAPMIATWPGLLSVGTLVWEIPNAPRPVAIERR
jgi:hypothetical protein